MPLSVTTPKPSPPVSAPQGCLPFHSRLGPAVTDRAGLSPDHPKLRERERVAEWSDTFAGANLDEMGRLVVVWWEVGCRVVGGWLSCSGRLVVVWWEVARLVPFGRPLRGLADLVADATPTRMSQPQPGDNAKGNAASHMHDATETLTRHNLRTQPPGCSLTSPSDHSCGCAKAKRCINPLHTLTRHSLSHSLSHLAPLHPPPIIITSSGSVLECASRCLNEQACTSYTMHTEDNDRFGDMCCLRRDDRWKVSDLFVGWFGGDVRVRVKHGLRDGSVIVTGHCPPPLRCSMGARGTWLAAKSAAPTFGKRIFPLCPALTGSMAFPSYEWTACGPRKHGGTRHGPAEGGRVRRLA